VVSPATARAVEQFLLSFDTGLAPAVGHQITFDGANYSNPTAIATLDSLTGQADASFCGVVSAASRAAGSTWAAAIGDRTNRSFHTP
jgi:hypothetical protein